MKNRRTATEFVRHVLGEEGEWPKQPGEFVRHVQGASAPPPMPRQTTELERPVREQVTQAQVSETRSHQLRASDFYRLWYGEPNASQSVLAPVQNVQGGDRLNEHQLTNQVSLPHRNEVVIGTSHETGRSVAIGDIERRSGLYILGRSGTGKTTLLENIINQDIQKGHGLFFLDPHGDAIDHVLQFADDKKIRERFLLLDPKDPTYSFCINPLACSDVDDWSARMATYDKARFLFKKIFEKESVPGEKPWLEMIIQNAFNVFIENPEYTLAEIPRFLSDAPFRKRLLRNVEHHWFSVLFWEKYFQPKQMEAALTRLTLLLSDDRVAHIIGQQKTTIDFAEVIERKQVLLLKLSTTLAPDVKAYIGTILINELVHAVMNRESIPEEKRHQFCVFVDEFQNFAGSDDFAILFNQARKFGVATAVAHQERRGQFAEFEAISGATAAATNMALFRTTRADGDELAPEVALPPPTETRLERQLAISNYPVKSLLQAHKNPIIMGYVNRYLRPMAERVEDIKDELTFDRLLRLEIADEAGILGIEAQLYGMEVHSSRDAYLAHEAYHAQRAALQKREALVLASIEQTRKMMNLHEQGRSIRLSMRAMDHFLTALMEGRIAQGREAFSIFLINMLHATTRIPQEYIDILELYITLKYGNPYVPREIPTAFAETHGLYSEQIAEIRSKGQEKLQQEKEALLWEEQDRYEMHLLDIDSSIEKDKRLLEETVWQEVSNSRLRFPNFGCYKPDAFSLVVPESLVKTYITLHAFPSVQRILAPYYTAKFSSPWREEFPSVDEEVSAILASLQTLRQINIDVRRQLAFDKEYDNWFRKDEYRKSTKFRSFVYPAVKPPTRPALKYGHINRWKGVYFGDAILDAFQGFLERYGEGAFVTLVLLETAGWPRGDKWRKRLNRYGPFWWNTLAYDPPYGLSMLDFPTIAGLEPIKVAYIVQELEEVLPRLDFPAACAKYYWHRDGESPYRNFKRHVVDENYNPIVADYRGYYKGWETITAELNQRMDVQLLRQILHQIRDRNLYGLYLNLTKGGSEWFMNADKLMNAYFLARACDIGFFSMRVADLTFPRPTISGVSAEKVDDLAIWLSSLLHGYKRQSRMRDAYRGDTMLEHRWGNLREELREFAKAMHDEYVREILAEYQDDRIVPMPAKFHVGVLSSEQMVALLELCIKALREEWRNADSALRKLDDFVEFCELLMQPDNHIMEQTGQYVERKVYLRDDNQMAAEMRQELINLEAHAAYVKLIQGSEGEQSIYKGKIKTLPPPGKRRLNTELERKHVQERMIKEGYLISRKELDRELRRRAGYRSNKFSDEPPPTRF